MQTLHGTYVHRGDKPRRRRRIQQVLLLSGVVMAACAALVTREPGAATAAAATAEASMPDAPFYLVGEARRLYDQLADARGELAIATAQLERAKRIIAYSSEYGISAGLAELIFDVSVAEGIDPALTFRIVSVESNFNPRATSPVGAIGLAQVMVGTARYFQPGITQERLYDPETNLRIGLRYLRSLLDRYEGDVRTALLVYNRGPVAVHSSLAAGVDPANGYERLVLRGYQGTGRLD